MSRVLRVFSSFFFMHFFVSIVIFHDVNSSLNNVISIPLRIEKTGANPNSHFTIFHHSQDVLQNVNLEKLN